MPTQYDALRNSLRGWVDTQLTKMNLPQGVYQAFQNAMKSGNPDAWFNEPDHAQGHSDSDWNNIKQYWNQMKADHPNFAEAGAGMYSDDALKRFVLSHNIDPNQSEADIRSALDKAGYTEGVIGDNSYPILGSDKNSAAPVTTDQVTTDATDQQKKRNDVQAQLQAFADQMSKYDPNDPLGKQIQQMAATQSQNQALGAGINPNQGLGAVNQASISQDAATRYQLQRQQMGQAALGQLGSMAQNGMGFAEGQRQFNNNFGLQLDQYQQQLAQQAYQADQQQRQGIGGLIGGGLGAGIGGWLGGPQGAAQGAKIGGQIGGGFGGMTAGPYTGYQQSRYYNGGLTGSGGSGGYNRGGNY